MSFWNMTVPVLLVVPIVLSVAVLPAHRRDKLEPWQTGLSGLVGFAGIIITLQWNADTQQRLEWSKVATELGFKDLTAKEAERDQFINQQNLVDRLRIEVKTFVEVFSFESSIVHWISKPGKLSPNISVTKIDDVIANIDGIIAVAPSQHVLTSISPSFSSRMSGENLQFATGAQRDALQAVAALDVILKAFNSDINETYRAAQTAGIPPGLQSDYGCDQRGRFGATSLGLCAALHRFLIHATSLVKGADTIQRALEAAAKELSDKIVKAEAKIAELRARLRPSG